MKTISVCLIVKNEELVIERCLKCVQKFADEIIIVDTGSIDKTEQIASRFTNNIYHFQWVDDFSKARNYSFSLATCAYVMWLDADDVISDECIDKINLIKQNDDTPDVYMLKYAIAFDKENKPTFVYYRERILKRENGFKWSGFIHEAITPRGEICYVDDVVIEHRKTHNSNPERNLQIYEKHRKKGVIFEPRAQYYYSKELYYNGYYLKAIQSLKKYLKMENKFYPNEIDAYVTVSRCYTILKQYYKALQTMLEVFKIATPNAEICCTIAECFVNVDKVDSAIFYYKSALIAERNERNGMFVRPEFYEYIPCLQLSVLLYNKGEYDEAKKYHLRLKVKYPNDDIVINNDKFFVDESK